jgi:hypothetical protein
VKILRIDLKKFYWSMPSKLTNAASSWVARLATDEQTAEKLGVWLSESLEPTQAVSLVDKGQSQWQVAIHLTDIPDQQKLQALVAIALGSAAA